MRSRDNFKIKYSNYYIAFLDALGFSEKVRNANTDNLKSISTHFSVLKKALDNLKKIKARSGIKGFVISDSVIIALPGKTKNEDQTETLIELCKTVGEIQWELAKYNIWFRGAITFGSCWISEDGLQITGPAYLKALELEKAAAKYPRVIVDAAILNSLQIDNRVDFIETINGESSTTDRSSFGPIFDWARTKRADANHFLDDTMLFIDYLGIGVLKKNIKQLNMIIDYLQKSLCEQNIYEKYRWLVNYCLIRVATDYFGGLNPHLEEPYKRLQHL